MPDIAARATQYTDALQAQDEDALAALLGEQVVLRRWEARGVDRYRGRNRVLDCFKKEWSSWQGAKFSPLSRLASENKTALEYRVQVNKDGRLIEYNRAEFLTFAGDAIDVIESYCPEAIPSGPRGTVITHIDESRMDALLESLRYSFDLREYMSPDTEGIISLRGAYFAGSQPHPGSNLVFGVRWTEEEADALIEKQIDYFRRRELGFCWYVSPLDTPPDLGERLVKQGLVYAGSAATMVRLGLDSTEEIPINPQLQVLTITPDRPDLYDEALSVEAVGFHTPAEQIERMRKNWRERSRKPELINKERNYLARLDEKPVGFAAMQLEGTHAYMNGAATLPEYRGRKIYSTLLRKRLEDAHALGMHLATVDAEPMSRRVVTRYGFKEYGKVLIYAWMPVIDMEVIRKLVPDE